MADILISQREKARVWAKTEQAIKSLLWKAKGFELEESDPCYLPHQKLDGMPRGTDVSSPTEATALRLVEQAGDRRKIAERLKEEALALERGIMPWRLAVAGLPNLLRTVLHAIYISRISADDVGKSLGVSRATVYNLERRALMEIWKTQIRGTA